MPTSETYATTVRVPRSIQRKLRDEQARRVLKNGKKTSMSDLASEYLTKAVEELSK